VHAAAERFGGIDVLEYSPAPHIPTPGVVIAGPLEVTVENLQPKIEFNLYGAVLPAMVEAGAGPLLFTTGGSSVTPNAMLGNVNAAATALRSWVLNLGGVLADKGVLAAHYWDLYQRRALVHFIGHEDHYPRSQRSIPDNLWSCIYRGGDQYLVPFIRLPRGRVGLLLHWPSEARHCPRIDRRLSPIA
jgi:hypothetical protein